MQLGLSNRSTGHFAILIGGQKYLEKVIQFNEELYEKQIEAARNFWEEFVQKDLAPMAIAKDNEENLVDLFPEASEKMVPIEDIVAQADLNVAIEHRLEIIKEIDAAMEEKATIDAKLKQIVGENAGIMTNRFIVTWKNVSRTTADPEALKEAGLFDKYSKTSVSRNIRVSAKKEGEKK